MKNISVKAPGKLLLMGEHAVVYGYKSIVTAVDQHMYVNICETNKSGVELITPQVKDTSFVDYCLEYFSTKHKVKLSNIKLTTECSFSGVYGFGSSAAVTAATIYALDQFYNLNLTRDELFSDAYDIVFHVQKGIGSGFDVASSIYGGTIGYIKGKGKTVDFTSFINHKNIIIGYSGTKANTVEIVKNLAEKREKNKSKIDKIFSDINQLVTQAEDAVITGNFKKFGNLLNYNHKYLTELGVSTVKLDEMVNSAISAGAYGAKLSGAGGGDCMIAIVDEEHIDKVKKAINSSGGEVIENNVNANGVSIHTSDNQKELFIVIDPNDNIISYKTRYECHHDKTLLHRTVGAVIYNNQGQILLQKRSMTKDTDPGFWAISCAGHVTKGQTDDEAIERELEEELGIKTKLKMIKKYFVYETYESERAVVYQGIYEGEYKINKTEVSEVKYFTKEEINKYFKNGTLNLTHGAEVTFKEIGIL